MDTRAKLAALAVTAAASPLAWMGAGVFWDGAVRALAAFNTVGTLAVFSAFGAAAWSQYGPVRVRTPRVVLPVETFTAPAIGWAPPVVTVTVTDLPLEIGASR